MKHGELKEYITPKTTKEDFLRRVKNAFSATAQPAPASSQAATTTATSSTPDAEAGPAPTSNASQQSDHVRRILAERAAKLHAQKEEADRKAKDARLKAKEKAKAEADAGEDTEAAKKHKHTEIVKQQKQQAREARERVLKRIEDDKEERRSRAVEQEKIRLEGQKVGDVAASLVKSPETKMPSTTKVGEMTYIQVRLFDGSSIRTRFKTASPLKDARTWVDESRTDGNTPYTFKQVISPTQNKAIDVTEEKESLGDLGFAPSATLVLIPVPTYASAYGMASGNVLTQFFTFVVGIFTWIFSLVGLGGRRGPAREDDATDRPERSQAQGSQGPEDRRRDQQLYNGNSVCVLTAHSQPPS